MDRTDTRQRLDRITDPGLFEELATAVLRELDHRCGLLAHVGTNPEGRTVPSSLDGITYFSDEGVRRMVAVHHTIQRNLRPKWLNDDGDVPKTIDLDPGTPRASLSATRSARRSVVDLQCTAVFRRVPEGYIAFVEEFPGANTQGASLEEARTNLREAVALVVEANRELAREDADGETVIREPITVTA